MFNNNNNTFSSEKVTVNYNPYFYEDTQISINTVEQITFNHKKINETRVIGEFLKDKNYSKWMRRGILKDICKFWEKEFKNKINIQKEELLNKTETVKRKKIRKFDYTSIYAFASVTLFGIMVKVNLFHSTKIRLYLSRPLFNNVLLALIYFSLIACLYMICTKSYYEVTRLIGNNSKKFIYQEFRGIKKGFNAKQRELKGHLTKYVNLNSYKQLFKLKKIYDPQIVILNLEKYRFFIQDKMVQYSKNYYKLLVIAFLFKLIVLGLIVFLGISYLNL